MSSPGNTWKYLVKYLGLKTTVLESSSSAGAQGGRGGAEETERESEKCDGNLEG